MAQTENSATTPSEGADPHEANVATNTALAFATQVVTAVLTAFLTLYLTRALGPHGFGRFSLAIGVIGVLIVIADGGIAPAVGRFIAEQRGDRSAVSRLLGNALAMKLLLGLLTSGALIVFAAPVAHAYGDPGLTWPLRGVAVAMFGQSILMLFSSALVSVERISANLAVYTVESVAETIASVAFVVLGGGAAGAAWGRAAGYVVGGVASAILAARVFGWRGLVPYRPDRATSVPIIRYAGVLLIVSGAWTLFSQVDILLIGAYVGATQVAFFSAPIRLCNVLHYPGLAVSNSVAPRLARRPGSEPDVASFMTSLRLLVILQAAMVAPALIWARPIILLLLGRHYAPAAPVLRALTPFLFFQGIGPLVSVGVNYLGESRQRIWIAAAAFIIDLLLDVILIPKIGALGGAVATSVAYGMYVPAHLLICRRLLSISLRPLMVTTMRSLAAAAAGGAVLFAVGTKHLSVADWVIGTVGGLAAFTAVLLLTREIVPSELRSVWVWLRARMG